MPWLNFPLAFAHFFFFLPLNTLALLFRIAYDTGFDLVFSRRPEEVESCEWLLCAFFFVCEYDFSGVKSMCVPDVSLERSSGQRFYLFELYIFNIFKYFHSPAA